MARQVSALRNVIAIMFYEVASGHGLPNDPFKAIVAPRPIGWVTTMNRKGEVNLSPYSFFNIISERPHLVSFSSMGRKDSMSFAEEGGDFVCNVATWDLRAQVNATSAPFPRGVDEMAVVGLEPHASRMVRSPRVAASPAALECRWVETVTLKAANQSPTGYFLVIGEVVGVHIQDRLIVDGRVDTVAMHPILRGGYHDYFSISTEGRFAMKRPEGGGNTN